MESSDDIVKAIRKKCASILKMKEDDCVNLLGEFLFEKEAYVRSWLLNLHNQSNSQHSVRSQIRHKNVCLTMRCDLECTGRLDLTEWDIVIKIFGDETAWLRLHDGGEDFKQCVQMMILYSTFTIRESTIYGNKVYYHSFRSNKLLNDILDKNRASIVALYNKMLQESGHKIRKHSK